MHGCEADELDDDESAEGEDDSACFAEDVEENLCDWLSDARAQNVVHIAHAEAEDDGKKPAHNVGEEHSHADGPWGLDLGLDDFLCDVGRRVVVSHGPAHGKETEEERPSDRRPAGNIVGVGEDVMGGVFRGAVARLSQGQKGDTAGYQNEDMEDHIGFCHLLHPVSR